MRCLDELTSDVEISVEALTSGSTATHASTGDVTAQQHGVGDVMTSSPDCVIVDDDVFEPPTFDDLVRLDDGDDTAQCGYNAEPKRSRLDGGNLSCVN